MVNRDLTRLCHKLIQNLLAYTGVRVCDTRLSDVPFKHAEKCIYQDLLLRRIRAASVLVVHDSGDSVGFRDSSVRGQRRRSTEPDRLAGWSAHGEGRRTKQKKEIRFKQKPLRLNGFLLIPRSRSRFRRREGLNERRERTPRFAMPDGAKRTGIAEEEGRGCIWRRLTFIRR